jgi:hypothetical protein
MATLARMRLAWAPPARGDGAQQVGREFWPYRTSAEGQMLYETATEFDAPISVEVRTGQNNATVRFQAQ